MLSLADRYGRRQREGANRGEISILPTYIYTPDSTTTDPSADNEQNTDIICMSEFQTGEMLRILPCFHRVSDNNPNPKFHKACIDQWLKKKAECP